MDILCAVAAFVGGAALAYLNYCISKAFLKKKNGLVPSFMLRQLLNVGYLVALFVLTRTTDIGRIPTLLGGALGMTIPSFFLANRLMKKTQSKEESHG